MFKDEAIFLLLIFLFSCKNDKVYKNDSFPFFRDKKEFPEHLKNCSDKITYYYNINGKYPKSTNSLISQLRQYNLSFNPKDKGYITYSFIVNCEGKPGRFIINQLDDSFEKANFDSKSINQIKRFILNLNEFRTFKDLNYHLYFTFKLKNGKIVDILP